MWTVDLFVSGNITDGTDSITVNSLSGLAANSHNHTNKAQLDLVTDGDHDVRIDNPHGVDAIDVGLGNVDDTSDANKPISIAQQTALDLKEDKANKGVNNGYASLDSSGKVPVSQLPNAVGGGITVIGMWNANTNTPDLGTLTPNQGEAYQVSVAGSTSINGETNWKAKDLVVWDNSLTGNWFKIDNTDDVISVNSQTGIVTLTKTDVGLGNVDDVQQYPMTNPSGFETPSQLNTRDTNNRNRANHTGTQLAATISDFSNATLAIAQKKYNNVVVVNSLADLPTAVGGKRDFLANTKYFITSPLAIGTDYWNLGDFTVLDSINHLLTPITYTGTGAAIRGTNVNATIREIKVDGAAQGFAFTGNGTQVVSIFQSTFDNCAKIGTVDGFYAFFYKNNNHQGNTDGITITGSVGAGNYIFSGDTFAANNTGNYISVPSGTFNAIRLSSNNMDIPLGSVGMNIVELSITVLEFGINSNVLLGTSTTKISGFNPLNGDINSKGNIGIKNNEPHSTITSAEMFAIVNPTTGLPFYNSTLGELVYWDGTKWDKINDSTIFMEQLVADFETGLGGFVLVNSGQNDWVRDTVNPASGLYSLYISDNPTVIPGPSPNTYTTSGGIDVSHAYIDVLMPAASSQLAIAFDWLCEAEVGWDWLSVYDVPTTTTPVANVELTTGQIGLSQYNNQLTFINSQIALPIGEAGTTRRIVFSFRNDSLYDYQPPANIDNVKILYL